MVSAGSQLSPRLSPGSSGSPLRKLGDGRVDPRARARAFIYDSLSIYRQHRRHPDTTRALLTPFRKETWAIGLRKSDKALRQQIDLFLEQFKQEGGFEKLGDEFLPEEKAYFKRNGIPFYF